MGVARNDIAAVDVWQGRQQHAIHEYVESCLHVQCFFFTSPRVFDEPWHFEATAGPEQHEDQLMGEGRQLSNPRVGQLALYDDLVDKL